MTCHKSHTKWTLTANIIYFGVSTCLLEKAFFFLFFSYFIYFLQSWGPMKQTFATGTQMLLSGEKVLTAVLLWSAWIHSSQWICAFIRIEIRSPRSCCQLHACRPAAFRADPVSSSALPGERDQERQAFCHLQGGSQNQARQPHPERQTLRRPVSTFGWQK